MVPFPQRLFGCWVFSLVRLALRTNSTLNAPTGLVKFRSDRVCGCVCYTNTVFLKMVIELSTQDEGTSQVRSCPQGLPPEVRCGTSRCNIPDRGPPLGAPAVSES
ncbi:hypothetical protein EDB86DRAFT_1285934 [Lactarius hatsudake]|nr:hypothetical protein EDB86DRAFT_1285934 [Lactarius hatsudake]